MKKLTKKLFIVVLTSGTLFGTVGCEDNSAFEETSNQSTTENLASRNASKSEENLKEFLDSYKKKLRENNVKIGSKESLNIFNSVISEYNEQGQEIKLSQAAKNNIKNLGSDLSQSISPENAYKILEDNYNKITNSKEFSSAEKEILININQSIKITTQFLVKEYKENGFVLSQRGRGDKKSWWRCVCDGYEDLTDNFVGQMTVGLLPELAVPAIIIGGTINYYNQ